MRMRYRQEGSGPAKVLVLGLVALAAVGLAIVLATAPAGSTLLGENRYALEGALHGVAAGLFMVTATIGLFQAYRLITGTIQHPAQLEFGSVVNAVMALVTILLGNRIYIYYRASGGPRTYFMEHSPEIHKIFFEFKEFSALFTFPLAVAAAYLFLAYGPDLLRRRDLRNTAALLLILTFFYFLVAFGLGAAITKLRAIG